MMICPQRLEPFGTSHQATEQAQNLAATQLSPRAVWMLWCRFFAMAHMMKRLEPLASLHSATEQARRLDATRSSPRAAWML